MLDALFLAFLPALLPTTPVLHEDELAAPSSPSPAAVVERVLELGRTQSRVHEHLDHLSNAIGPRLTTSSNLETAEQWCRDRFAEWGLDARLERWGAWDVGFDRGPWSGRMLAPEEMELDFITPSWTPGTDGPKRGRAVKRPTSMEELEERRAALAGAWVVGPGRTERTRRESLELVDAALAELGILGEIRRSGDELVHTSGNYRVQWDELPQTVTMRLRGDQHDAILAHLDAGREVELEIDAKNTFRQGPIELFNVVADIRGSELPDEYVIVGAHLDSWDGATGTCDNGTGVSTTLEAARLLMAAGAKPRRTIRFLLFSGEEQGLFGSKGWVRDHADEMERISAVLVHDGGTNFLAGLAGPAALIEDLRAAFAPVKALDPEMPFRIKQNEGLTSGGSSDHAPFVQAGVPGFFWSQEGRADYDRVHHTQYDTFDAAVPEYQQHSALVVAVGALGIADLPSRLDRTGLIRPQAFRRRMGVFLDGLVVTSVAEDSHAERAGWQEGDALVSIDGVELKGRRDVSEQLNEGGPVKLVVLLRGEERIETTLDFTEDEREHAAQNEKRGQRAGRRGERRASDGDPDAEPAEEDAPPERETPAETP